MPATGDGGQYPMPDPPTGSGTSAGQWYAVIGGASQGPMSLIEMQGRVTGGGIKGETLVWKQGMSSWTPAHNVPELFPASGSSPPPPPPPSLPSKSGAGLNDLLAKLDGIFSNPKLFRIIGRVCAVIAVLISVFSPPAALQFALAFFIGEAAGAVLEAVQGSKSPPEAEESADDGP